MAPNRLCTCESHGCGQFIDISTKLYGVSLPYSVWKSHQNNDRVAPSKVRLSSSSGQNVVPKVSVSSAGEAQAQNINVKSHNNIAMALEAELTQIEIRLLNTLRHAPKPTTLICYDAGLNALANRIDMLECHRDISVMEAKEAMKNRIGILRGQLQQVITQEKLRLDLSQTPAVYLDQYRTSPMKNFDPVLALALFFIIVLNVVCGLSRRGATFALNCTRELLIGLIASTLPKHMATLHWSSNKSSIPSDIRTVSKVLQVVPKITRFATCSNCDTCYPPDSEGNYPKHCNFRKYEKSHRCHTPLFKKFKAAKPDNKSKGSGVLKRPYPFRDPLDWLSHFLARPEIIKALEDDSWKTSEHESGVMSDFFQAGYRAEFEARPDVSQIMASGIPCQHLLFMVCVDGLNPEGNKASGKSVSVSHISLVCLNLPPSLRYKPENVYIAGIIPGPREATVDTINNFLQPLVDAFKKLWNPGVWFWKEKKDGGMYVRAAIAGLVCDLPASKKVAGFASYSGDAFCSHCHCRRNTWSDFDYQSWQPRTLEEHRKLAEQYRNASSDTARARLISQSGVRWSALLELEYWDPTRHVVFDPMHGIFLRVVQNHFRNVLGIEVPKSQRQTLARGQVKPDPPTDVQVMQLEKALQKSSTTVKGLTNQHYAALWAKCDEHNILPQPRGNRRVTKAQMSQALSEWRLHDISTKNVTEKQNEICRFQNAINNGSLEEKDLEGLGKEQLQDIAAEYGALVPGYLIPPGNEGDATLRQLIIDVFSNKRAMTTALINDESNSDSDDPSDNAIEADFWDSQAESDEEDTETMTDESGSRATPRVLETHASPHVVQEERGVIDSDDSIARNKPKRVGAGEKRRYPFEIASTDEEVTRYIRWGAPKKHETKKAPARKKAKSETFPDKAFLSRKRKTRSHPAVNTDAGKLFGRDLLEELWDCIANTQVPSWVSTIPTNFGSAQHGKLKADQWRSAATVYLPLALTIIFARLLPDASDQTKERLQDILKNTMDLMEAVRLIASPFTSAQVAKKYTLAMKLYLEGLKRLFPGKTFKPSHHFSLHLEPFLLLYGPVHSWWTFVYERLVKLMQEANTNHKIGQLEETMLISLSSLSSITAMFGHNDVPESILACQAHFNRLMRKILPKGTLASDILQLTDFERRKGATHGSSSSDATEKPINVKKIGILNDQQLELVAAHLKLPVPHTPRLCSYKQKLTHRGFQYTTRDSHVEDSHIIFQPSDGGEPVAAQIEHIFEHIHTGKDGPRHETLIFVGLYQPATGYEDPFKSFPFLRAGLWLKDTNPDLRVISVNQILSHFASCPFDKQTIAIMPVTRDHVESTSDAA